MRFTARHKMFLCERFARYESVREIVAAFEAEYGEKIHHGRVLFYKNSPKWMPVIEELRRAWTENLGDEILSNKRARLRILEKAVNMAIKEKNPKAIVSAVRQGQEETEGRKLRLAGHDGKQLKMSLTERLAQLEESGELEQDEPDPY